uniref:Uncharacterized protein n=1 Tax=Meloidogyne enterolobii TaxID=390850 RepID=A0A6V7TK36_MELEN|nr:unnamed protein product [Meloidogyne enterolobii]
MRENTLDIANPTLKNVAEKSDESSVSQKSFQESSTLSEGKDEFDFRLRKYATNSDTPNSSDDGSSNSNADQYSLPEIPQMVSTRVGRYQKSFQEIGTESEGKDEFTFRKLPSVDGSLNHNAEPYSLPKIPQMVSTDGIYSHQASSANTTLNKYGLLENNDFVKSSVKI